LFSLTWFVVPTLAAGRNLNQQQLQIARAALWRQTAATAPASPLLTFDDAAHWLDDLGLCLFLPRHTQFPAPAPSFVEACLGAAAVTPPPAAIATATELATRLIEERRAIPLNLLGVFSEQPDFLVTTEILPWVVAVRGDRQWKSAPTGRTAPIVLRTWEALDREGELTAVQIRETLGRELTEAAVLRALIELWTNLRAMPIYAANQPTRWTLLKNRFPAQLATAANTAQSTALSVLVSLYLRTAVAATAEEAEVFLSPLTARSRIREVLHGMLATRQLGSTTVAAQTLLFVEGSLPDTIAAPEPEHAPEPTKTFAPPATPSRATRAPFRKAPSPTKWELPNQSARPQQDRRPPWQKKPAAPHRPAEQPEREAKPHLGPRPDARTWPRDSKPSFAPRFARPGAKPRVGSRPDSRPSRPGSRPSFGSSRGRPGSKPWQRRPDAPFRKPGSAFRKQEGPSPDARPPLESRQPTESRPPNEQRRPNKKFAAPQSRQNRTWQKDRPFRDRRPPRSDRPAGTEHPGEKRPFRPQSPRPGSFRPGPGTKFGGKPGAKFSGISGGRFGPKPARKFGSKPSGKFGSKQGARFSPRSGAKPRFSAPRPPRAEKPGEGRPDRPTRPFRPGKSLSSKPNRPTGRSPRPTSRSPRPARPDKLIDKLREPATGEPKPRKNRNRKENPE
jgi:hypothetical protein